MKEVRALSYKLKNLFSRRDFVVTLIVFCVIFFVLLTNAVHESYPDEFDNIAGGWFMLHGKFLYSGYFTHHNPVAYILAALVEIFSGRSFVRFRFIYTVFLFAYYIFSYLFVKRRFSTVIANIYLVFLAVLSFTSVYFWGQMLLADNLSAYLLVPVFAFLLLAALYKRVFTQNDLIFVSVLSFLALFSSLTYIYLVIGLYLYTWYFYLKHLKFSWKEGLLRPFVIFAVPYVVLLIYLLITGSLIDYINMAIIFNGKYYVYNYPGHQEGVGFINPIRYLVVILHNFFNDFTVLLIQVSTFNFNFPFNISLAVANVGMTVYLLFRRKYAMAALLIFYIIFANVRSDPLTSKETDYQSAVYIVVSLFNGVFALYEIQKYIKDRIFDAQKAVLVALFLLLGIYSFFSTTYLLRSYGDKVYDKYMGYQALIYDRPQIAPIINAITTPNEYAWIGPFNFEDLFYLNAKVPSKFVILIPGFKTDTTFKQQMLADFQKNPPIVMYFDKSFFILGRSPEMYGQFFIHFVDNNYVTLQDLVGPGASYQSVIPVSDKIDLESNLYIRKDATNQILQRMLDKGLIKPSQ